MDQGLDVGFQAVGPTFLPVGGGDKVNLADIAIKGHDGECADEVFIQSLTADGDMVAGSVYTWYNFIDGADVYYGWMNEGGDFVTREDGVEYDIAEGVWLNSTSNELSYETSGEVDQIGSSYPLDIGFQLVCNTMPMNVNLFDVKVEGHDGECADEVFIQSLTADGDMVAGSVYTWYNFIDGDDVYYGWMNEGGDFVTREDGITYKPGEGIWVNSSSDELAVEYPGVEIK